MKQLALAQKIQLELLTVALASECCAADLLGSLYVARDLADLKGSVLHAIKVLNDDAAKLKKISRGVATMHGPLVVV